MAEGSPRPRNRLLRAGSYLLLAVAVYLVALWFFLPYPDLGRRLETELARQGIGLEIRGLGPGTALGFAAETVALFPPEIPELRWQFADVTARVLLQRLISGERAARIQARTLDGTLSLTALWQQSPQFTTRWSELRLEQAPLPEAVRDLPLSGATSGSATATLDPANPSRADGTFEAQFRDLRVGAGKVQGIPVPEVRLGDGTVRITAKEGKVEIGAAEFKNGDLEITFTGSILLRDQLPRSLINGMLSLRPNQQAAEDLALLFALFPGPKGSDGRYTARVRGSLGAPRLLKR